MQLASILLQGLVSALVGSVIGGIGLIALRSRAEGFLYGKINGYVAAIAKDLVEKPEKYANLVKPMLNKVVADFTKDLPAGAAGNLPVGDLASVGLNFLPKKYRGVAALAQMFLGNGGLGQKKPVSNPFERNV